MDIYKEYINKNEVSEKRMVTIGRVFGIFCLLLAVLIAPALGRLEQAFQFIQEFTGFVSPGALAIFLLGFFWKRANANGAIAAAIGTFVFSALMLWLFPEVSFINRMGYVFLLCVLVMVSFGLFDSKCHSEKMIEIDASLFRTTKLFKGLSICVLLILGLIYYVFW